MTRYLISFDDGAMTFSEEEGAAVGEAAHAVVREAQDAGVWIFGGGVASQRASIVATDGMVTDGPLPRDQGGHRRVRDDRRALPREGAGMGCPVRCRLPLRAGGPGNHFDPLV